MAVSPPISTPRDGLTSLSRLQGTWALRREIRHDSGHIDQFDGTCRFSPSGPRLLQDEKGMLQTTQGRFEATRRYVWTQSNGWLHIHFADMRPFVSLPMAVPQPTATHLCTPDRYDVVFNFGLWPDWESVWTVEGPRKSYVMTNRFSPA